MKNQLKVCKRLTVKSPYEDLNIKNIRAFWKLIENKINHRLKEFKNLGIFGDDRAIFSELVFCLFTPQSKALSCSEAVKILQEKDLLLNGNAGQIAKEINIVRFKNNKAKYLVEARDFFRERGKLKIKNKIAGFSNAFTLRKWLVKNIKGFGYKEASHFLRNIGLGEDIAILDRHILKNLKELRIIKRVPKTIDEKTYLQTEEKMRKYAGKVKIPLDHLDLLFWCHETGEIFK